MADVLIQRQNSAFPPLVDQLPICAVRVFLNQLQKEID